MNKGLVVLAITLALLMSSAAFAQSTHVTANVPFSFVAGSTKLPAGEYDVQSTGNGDSALSIRNVNSRTGIFVISNSRQSSTPCSRTALIFHRYGGRYFLSEIRIKGQKAGRQLPAGSREVEVAKDFAMDEVVLTAARN